jgi:hypothetical protein
MQISKDPLAPLRAWKELLMGERALKGKKSWRDRRRAPAATLSSNPPHVAVGE